MTKRIIVAALLATSVLGAAPAFAQAAPAGTDSDEVQLLKQQVQALQDRLDKIEADQQAAAAAPAPAPAPAPQVAAAPAVTVPDWVSSTKIGGKAYLNVSNIDQRSDGAPSSQDGMQAELKRFYLTVDHKFDSVFSANLTTDFRYGSNGLTKDDVLYVKKAYLQATLSPAFFVRVGAADMPWIPFAEGVYNYRFVENTLIDRTKYGTSSDWGVHVGGTFGNGLISYAVSAVNGAGYKTLSRSSDTVDLEGRISGQPIKNIVLAVGGYTGKLGKSADGQADTPHRATRFNALAAYASKTIRVGVEYFNANNWNNVTTVQSDKSSGWSAFGSYAFTPKIGVFGRYDWVNPNQKTNAPLKENYFNVGLDYQPVKNVDLALVYKRDSADNGLVATSNGTIGGTNHGTYDEIGIWSQFSF